MHPVILMERRSFILWTLTAPAALAAAPQGNTVRGRLVQSADAPPRLKTTDGREVELKGDAQTIAVLRDERLAKEDFEATGHFVSPTQFEIDPIFKRALFVYRNDKRMVVTYWCEICAIRTYAPGECQCCHQETALDPRDPSLDNATATPPDSSSKSSNAVQK
jgi:hypothetical protein